jgi:uncharacterized SAM-binding protein YcdF (DUF218 family)
MIHPANPGADPFVRTLDRSRSLLPWLEDWLSPAEASRSADLIFVLAGQEYRKHYALDLLGKKLAPRILFSVARFEIRRFSKLPLPIPLDLLKLAADVPPPRRHFFVSFLGNDVQVDHVLPGRLGTLTEMEALRRWLDENPEVRSVLIVSSRTHLRRLKICCRSLLSPKIDVVLVAASSGPSGVAEEQPGPIQTTLAVLVELFKVLLYSVLLNFRGRHQRPNTT